MDGSHGNLHSSHAYHLCYFASSPPSSFIWFTRIGMVRRVGRFGMVRSSESNSRLIQFNSSLKNLVLEGIEVNNHNCRGLGLNNI